MRLLESTGFKTAALLAVLAVVGVWIALADLEPGLSHLHGVMLSGDPEGNYYAIVEELGREAAQKHGTLENLASSGSVGNVEQLLAAIDGCKVQFALAQDGTDWGDEGALELIGRLPRSESVFFLGMKADSITRFDQLDGLKIGIGPAGSGTAGASRRILASRGFERLDLRLENSGITAQLDRLVSGELDLGVFVIDEDSKFIEKAVLDRGLQIAGFQQADVVARRLPFARRGRIGAGQYDAVKLVPPTDKPVLVIDTLVLGNRCASRSEVLGLLTLLQESFPGFIRHNKDASNTTGLPIAVAAQSFFQNDGVDLIDAHFPWLGDITPPTNWVHIIMVVSILFNIMGLWNRFRIWRIDANRVKAELYVPEIFGRHVSVEDLCELPPDPAHVSGDKRNMLDDAIDRLQFLRRRCRTQSLSILVPMGGELFYRYQEELMDALLNAMTDYRTRLDQPC